MRDSMEVMLSYCVYCERGKKELTATFKTSEEDALQFVKIKETRVLLCPDCRAQYAPSDNDDIEDLLNGPIDFPPGVTAVEHCCPELEYRGFAEDDCTKVLEMLLQNGYYVATCPYCGVTIRSLAED